MGKYLVKLSEPMSNRIFTVFNENDIKVVWESQYIQGLIAVDTEKTQVELDSFLFVEFVEEISEGTYS